METNDINELNLNDYFEIIGRRKWLFILSFLVISMIGGGVALFLPPVYKSTSTILIEAQEIPADFVMTTVTSYAEQRLQMINQRIMSTTRLLEIINRFDLYADKREKWATEQIVGQMREDISLDFINADVMDRRTGRATSATIAFTLSFEGKNDPNKVQTVANVLASLFLEENLKVRERQVSETSEFFEGEMEKITRDLDQINSKLASFKEKHINELPELLQVNMQSLHSIELNIERYNEQLRSMREKEEYLTAQLATIEPIIELPELPENLDADEKRLENLKLELINLQSRYSDKYPDIAKIKSEIARVENQIAANKDEDAGADTKGGEELPDNPAYINISSQLASTKAAIESIIIQKQELVVQQDKYMKRIAATPEVERKYKEIVNNLNTTHSKYDDLSRKLMEAKVAQGLESEQKGERFTLIDPARLPEKPFKPNRIAILLIGAILGAGAGVAVSALAEFSDHAIRKTETLALATQFPILTTIPEIVTIYDLRRKRKKQIIIAFVSIVIIAGGLAAFHYFVMDFYILWIKLSRRFA